MERRVIVAAVICMFLLLVACESKTTGKRVAIPEKSAPVITGNVVGNSAPAKAPAPTTGETGTTAAEALKELQSTGSITSTASNRTGTFYPPVAAAGTGKDVLAAKTRALMNQSAPAPAVKATGEFGSKYHTSSGDPTNLPSEYTSTNSH